METKIKLPNNETTSKSRKWDRVKLGSANLGNKKNDLFRLGRLGLDLDGDPGLDLRPHPALLVAVDEGLDVPVPAGEVRMRAGGGGFGADGAEDAEVVLAGLEARHVAARGQVGLEGRGALGRVGVGELHQANLKFFFGREI